MKKTHVGVLILSNGWGGAEESTFNIAKHIDQNRFDVTLLANDFLAGRYHSMGADSVVNLGGYESNSRLRKILTILKIQHTLRKKINELSIDILHFRLENTILTVGTMFPKIQVPFICTLSGDEARMYESPNTFEQQIIKKIIHTFIYGSSSQVTSVSHWLIKNFDQSVKEKIIVTPNGTSTSFYKPHNNVKKTVRKTVLYTGRLVEGKGIEDLVEVAKSLPEYDFLFAGKGPLDTLLTLPNTKRLGFVHRNDIVALYSKATICAYPSYAEGMPMVGLEAMACGKTLVASIAGFSDYITDGVEGLIIEPGNVDHIRQSIQELLENDTKRERMEKAAIVKAQQYDIAQTVKNYENLYRAIVAK